MFAMRNWQLFDSEWIIDNKQERAFLLTEVISIKCFEIRLMFNDF